MNVAAILEREGFQLVSVQATANAREIADTLAMTRAGAVPVMDGNDQLLGIITDQDLVRALAANGARLLEMTAGQLMTRAVRSVTPATPLADAMRLMLASGCRHLPVVDCGALLGVISVTDLARARVVEDEHTAAR